MHRNYHVQPYARLRFMEYRNTRLIINARATAGPFLNSIATFRPSTYFCMITPAILSQKIAYSWTLQDAFRTTKNHPTIFLHPYSVTEWFPDGGFRSAVKDRPFICSDPDLFNRPLHVLSSEPNPITWMFGLRICPGFLGCPPTGHIHKCYKYHCTFSGRASSKLGKIKYITGVNCCRVVLRSKFASHYQLNLYRLYFAMVICGWEYEHQETLEMIQHRYVSMRLL